jgi:hypothetical protein
LPSVYLWSVVDNHHRFGQTCELMPETRVSINKDQALDNFGAVRA